MGEFNKARSFASTLGKTSVDPRLVTILQQAASLSPYNVSATSGVRAYNPKTGTTNHPGGFAVDIRLIDPATGYDAIAEADMVVEAVAEDLDLTETALRAWVKRFDIDAGKGPPGALTTIEREELAQLRRGRQAAENGA